MHILFLTHRLPYAPNRGDRLRAFQELRFMAARHEVTLLSLVHDDEEAAHAHDLDGLVRETVVARVPHLANRLRGVVALAGRRPLTGVLLHSPDARPALERILAVRPPDLVLAYCSSMARIALEPPLHRLPLVIDMVDADSAKWAELGGRARPPLNWVYRREARLLAAFETAAIRRARVTFVVNDRERELLERGAGPGTVRVIQNGIDVDFFAPTSTEREPRTLVFCGVMDYLPNEAGAAWLATEVWPIVRRQVPDARLLLVGARPTPRVRALDDPDAGVLVTGEVADVRPYLWRSSVAAAPLHVARGVQNKVLEAVAAGLPVVVTPAVDRGLPDHVRAACRSAEDRETFAGAVVGLLSQTPEELRALAARCDLSDLTWQRRLAPLEQMLQEARMAAK